MQHTTSHCAEYTVQPLWVFAALRARALRAPVFLGLISRKQGVAPPRPVRLCLAATLT
jgi:hypothetical protein